MTVIICEFFGIIIRLILINRSLYNILYYVNNNKFNKIHVVFLGIYLCRHASLLYYVSIILYALNVYTYYHDKKYYCNIKCIVLL